MLMETWNRKLTAFVDGAKVPASTVAHSGTTVDPNSLWISIRATGATPIEAALLLWETNEPCAQAFALAKMEHWFRGRAKQYDGQGWSPFDGEMLQFIDEHPVFGNAVMESLEGLTKREILNLCGSKGLEVLPRNLTVHGRLMLDRCVNLRSLPKGLVVRGNLEFEKASSWDGIIPQDAVITGIIFCDLHPGGIGLEEWREVQ